MRPQAVSTSTSAADRRIDLVSGTAIPLRGNNIDTDRIIPARYLKAITFEGLGEHVFEDDRASMPNHPFENAAYAGASLLVVNENFGSGSSREHAPQALKRWGIGACVGESFSEIFLGQRHHDRPAVRHRGRGESVERLMAAAERQSADAHLTLSVAGSHVEAAGQTVPVRIPDAVREALLTGQWDATALLLDRLRRGARGLRPVALRHRLLSSSSPPLQTRRAAPVERRPRAESSRRFDPLEDAQTLAPFDIESAGSRPGAAALRPPSPGYTPVTCRRRLRLRNRGGDFLHLKQKQ